MNVLGLIVVYKYTYAISWIVLHGVITKINLPCKHMCVQYYRLVRILYLSNNIVVS